ncbi:hypothetical protein H0H93_016523, partial [Arthromyces matolae]
MACTLRIPGIDHFEELGAAVEFDPSQATRAMFDMLKLGLTGGPVWSECLTFILTIHIDISTYCPQFYRMVPTKTVISAIFDALWYAASLPKSNPLSNSGIKPPESHFPALLNPKNSLCVSLRLLHWFSYGVTEEGYSWAIYSLRYNLLALLYKAMYMDCYDQDDVCAIIGIILDSLSTYTIHRPVIR